MDFEFHCLQDRGALVFIGQTHRTALHTTQRPAVGPLYLTYKRAVWAGCRDENICPWSEVTGILLDHRYRAQFSAHVLYAGWYRRWAAFKRRSLLPCSHP